MPPATDEGTSGDSPMDFQLPGHTFATTSTLFKRRARGRSSGSTSAHRRKSHHGSGDRTPLRQKTHAQVQAEDDASWFRVPPAARETLVKQAATEEPERTEEDLARSRLLIEFGEVCGHFPVELYRSLMFMRQLDAAYLAKSRALDELCRDLQASTTLTESLELRKRITQLMQSSRSDRAEIAAEVNKLQTLVEHHAASLRQEIRKIEKPAESLAATNAHLAAVQRMATEDELSQPRQPEMATPRSHKPKSKSKQAQRKPAAEATSTPDHSAAKDKVEDAYDIPIDDDEPVYCYCNRVSFGKMLACENDACEGGEWFHFACLGLTGAPKGKWYCDTCREGGFDSRHPPKAQETAHQRRAREARERREKDAKRRRSRR